MKKEIPFPVEEASIEYQIFEEKIPGKKDRIRVLASAVSQKMLDEEVALLKQSSVTPKEILHTPFTIRKFSEMGGIQSGEPVALIDIGASFTEIGIYINLELKFARRIHLGGNDINEVLANPQVLERMGVPSLGRKEMETLKRNRGLSREHPFDQTLQGFQPLQYLSSIRSVLEQFQNEILRSFNYFSEGFHGKSVSRVYLIGGGALLKGIVEFLEKRLQTPVSLISLKPSATFQLRETLGSKTEELPRYYRMILTLASRLEEKKRLPSLGGIPIVRWIEGAAACFLILALIMGGRILGLNVHLKAMKSQWKRMAASYAVATKLKGLEDNVKAKRSRLNSFFVDAPYWEDVFRELSNVLPSGFHLETAAYQNGSLTMTGTYSQEKGGKENLTQFLASLSKGIFKEGKLISAREVAKGSGTFRFEISCRV